MAAPQALTARLSTDAAAWLEEALLVAGDVDELSRRWSGAGRRLGRQPVDLTEPFSANGWGADECGRALLLRAALQRLPAERHEALVTALYRTGDIRERQAVLRVLAFLPEPERFAPLAAEAVRTNVLSEIEALACDNPYPARHVPEEAFNQMVLKCLFNAIPLGRIVGLGERRSPELVRMVAAYASERRAAGRPVPADAALVLAPGET
jgi:hypothetical protein